MILLFVTIILLFIVALVSWRFFQWKKHLIKDLQQQSQVIEICKGPIEYQVYGSGKETVLFSHGSPGGFDQFIKHRSEFFKQFRVISISRFGYLRSPLSTAMTLPDQADAVAAFLDALHIDSVILSAGSGGGPLALAVAAYHPNRVSKLILYAVASQAMALEDNRPGVKALKAITRSDFLSWLLLVPLMGKPQKLVRMLVKDEKNQETIINNGQSRQFARAMSVMLPPSLRLPGMDNDERILKQLNIPKQQITAPTLIIHGDCDAHVPYAHSVALQQQLPRAKLITVKGGDHFIGYTHVKEIERAYREFFRTETHSEPLGQAVSN